MSPNDDAAAPGAELQLVNEAWSALAERDLGALEALLAPDAKWRSVWDGPENCQSRRQILDVFKLNLARGLRGTIDETIQYGRRVLVGFRLADPSPGGDRPLDDGIAYMVVTTDGGRIVELKGCADRAGAIRYAETGTAPLPVPRPPLSTEPPEEVVEPPAQRISGLIPFARVADVERSAAFYRHLGFVPKSIFKPGWRIVWAALESDGAELMLEETSEPVDTERQGVLFYLYSHDLVALREQLLAGGIEAGEIVDGSPGPREEMRVLDPDGYVLMVAQIER